MKFVKIIQVIILFAFIYNGSANSQTENECRVYLNFPYYSFEISGGFPQVYKISSRYSLFSPECNSFLDLVFANPILNEILFPEDKTPCKVYYENFFNRCRCDSTSSLYIYKTPESVITDAKKKIFNKKLFDASLLEIRDSALKTLSKAYPQYKIKIEVSSDIRSVKDQESFLKKGSSTTMFSAHILGAAADFTIYFNGRLIDPKPKGIGLFQSTEPYQILGKFVLDKNYFWGIPWDPGHIQLKRKFDEILTVYPDFQNDGNLITAYCSVVKADSIQVKYKPVIEMLDKKFGIKETRKYDMLKPWVEDTLLLPITVDPAFIPKY
jgi:hypothetical protein